MYSSNNGRTDKVTIAQTNRRTECNLLKGCFTAEKKLLWILLALNEYFVVLHLLNMYLSAYSIQNKRDA